jgi:gamma-glutamyltranspeptidase/glutathione hydrolase/leukotriene-C4 hydrolase
MSALNIDINVSYFLFRDVLRDGGSVVDAAIATLFCNGIFNPHSMGVGGGFFMTVYKKETGEVQTLIARETAPSYAHKDMFEDNPEMAVKGNKNQS